MKFSVDEDHIIPHSLKPLKQHRLHTAADHNQVDLVFPIRFGVTTEVKLKGIITFSFYDFRLQN
jgi:hypothetical protein